jgi:uncharacterized protein YlaI
MKHITARCLLCGKNQDVTEEHPEYNKLEKQGKSPVFICDICSHKVRHESDEERKEKKPI